MAKHQMTGNARGHGMPYVGPKLGQHVRIGFEQVRRVLGKDIVAGDLLPTGLVLQVDRNEIDGESRLEMVGSNIHYVDHDDTLTVLARVDREILDAISVGTFLARKGL